MVISFFIVALVLLIISVVRAVMTRDMSASYFALLSIAVMVVLGGVKLG